MASVGVEHYSSQQEMKALPLGFKNWYISFSQNVHRNWQLKVVVCWSKLMGVYPSSIYIGLDNSKMLILIWLIRWTPANWNSLQMQNWRRHCWMQIFVKHLMTVSKILKSMGAVRKQENSMPYELKPRDTKKHFTYVNCCFHSKKGKVTLYSHWGWKMNTLR